jgi:cytochrome c
MMRHALGAVLAGAVLWCGAAAHAEGDADKGKVVFSKCGICHSPKQGVNMVGPSLFGIVGRHSATVPNFNYSPAMQELNIDWTPETLDRYVTDPHAMVPKTKMIFPGLKSETDRENLIAYLQTLK